MTFKFKGLQIRQDFPNLLPDQADKEGVFEFLLEADMAKTMALFFVLGLMVSCASHHNDRVISSLDKAERDPVMFHERNYAR